MKLDPPSPVISTKELQGLVSTQQQQLSIQQEQLRAQQKQLEVQHTEILSLQDQHRIVIERLKSLEINSDKSVLLDPNTLYQ